MEQQRPGLAVQYGRRAFWTKTHWVLMSAGLAVALAGAAAQDTAKQDTQNKDKQSAPAKPSDQTKSNQTKSSQTKPNQNGQQRRSRGNAGSTFHIVPMNPNQAQPPGGVTRSAPPPGQPPGAPPGIRPGGPPITILPNGNGSSGFGGVASGTPFAFDFHGSDINNVLQFFSRMSGLTVTTDPSLTGTVTIINPKPVTLDDAFKILQSVLQVRGFSAVQNGNVLAIEPMDKTLGYTPLISSDVPDGENPSGLARNQVMTQVIPLENADAKTLSTELAPLINKGASLIGSAETNSLILTDLSSNVQRFIKLVDALDKVNSQTQMKIYPLKRAEASALADLINNLYSKNGPRVGGIQVPGQPPMPQMPQLPGMAKPSVTAVADPHSNSVIVVASPDNQQQIAEGIINKLDGEDSNALETKFRKIKYADAQSIANQINTVLSNMHGAAATSSGGGFRQPQFGGGFFGGGFGGFGGNNNNNTQVVDSSDPLGKVVADPRTNTVVITASQERMIQIDQWIDQLDVDVPVETTTFVFPLKNAQADDVAYALGQAFGTSNTNNNNNPFGFFGFGGGNNNNNSLGKRQPIQRRLGGSSSSTGRSVRSGQGVPPGPPNAPDGGNSGDNSQDNTGSAEPQGVQGVMTPDGQFIPTQSSDGSQTTGNKPAVTRQFGFGFGGRQQQRLGQNTGPQYGPGRNGSYANLLQLQNNVFVTAAPNGDGLIITTTPNNYEALKQIIESLDVVPRQVMIEAIVAEVTLDNEEQVGWALTGNLFHLFNAHTNAQGQLGLSPTGSGGSTAITQAQNGAQVVLSGTNYSAILQALTTDSKVKVLSTPRVFTSNNQQADIEITTNVPYITGQVNGFFSTTVTNNVQYQQIGLTLNVTPRITRQGLVTIDVQQEASDLVRFITLGTGANAITAPEFNDRYTDTSVTIQDGQTAVIGGLIQDRHELDITKVPILGDIPLIGQFFRGRDHKHSKVELMIFLTPHVVSSVDEVRDMTIQNGTPVIKQFSDIGNQDPNLELNAKKKIKSPNMGKPGTDKKTPPPTTPGTPDNGGQ